MLALMGYSFLEETCPSVSPHHYSPERHHKQSKQPQTITDHKHNPAHITKMDSEHIPLLPLRLKLQFEPKWTYQESQ